MQNILLIASLKTTSKIIDLQSIYILEADKSYVKHFADCIHQNNYASIPQEIYELLIHYGFDLKAKLKECGYSAKEIKTDPLDSYLIGGNKYSSTLYFNKIANIPIKMESSEDIFSSQHFASTFEIILRFFGNQLEPVDIRYSLVKIRQQEKIEVKKGRGAIYHGRTSKAFVCNNVFKKILEIYYDASIKPHWYTIHHRLPHQYPSYDRALEIQKTGAVGKWEDDRQFMQFASDLFGSKGGSAALKYVLENRNVDDSRGIMPISEMFELLALNLGLKKDALNTYYLRYKECFDVLYMFENKFKHGTMLMYSLSEPMLSNFTYVTHDSGGKKNAGVPIDGKATFDTKLVLDTLKNSPEKFDHKDKIYEYIMVCGQDHPNDKNKLGLTNPFNNDVDMYQFNFGDDIKVAATIQKGIGLIFNRIRQDMINDGIIKDSGNFIKETIYIENRTMTSKI